MTLVKSISGIRGIVNSSLNIEIVGQYVKAFSNILPDGPILLARDTRNSGSQYIANSCKILSELNRESFIADIIPTPTAQYIVSKNNLVGAIVFTASHNPSNWNGMKFIDLNGIFINQQTLDLLENEKNKQNKIFSINNNHDLHYENKSSESIDLHINSIHQLSVISSNLIKDKKIKVVVDCVNGAASKALPGLLESFNCDVTKIHCDYNENFGRSPEPIPDNLKDLSSAVINNQADIGFATDPDGDRLSIVDNFGIPLGEELTLSLSVYYLLKYHQKFRKYPVVTNLSTSLLSEKISKNYNTQFIRTPVGEINVVKEMQKTNSLIGGEGNGGIILKESHLGRDSLVGAAIILNLLCNENKNINQITNNFPKYHIVKSSIKLEKFNFKLFDKIKNHFSDEKIEETDGLKILWEHEWIHIRKSNTEPILRIISEAQTVDMANKLVDKIKALIN